MEEGMKAVYLKFEGRTKRVKFQTGEGIKDWMALRKSLQKAALSDVHLQQLMPMGTTIIFQKQVVKKNGEKILLDVEEEEECNISDDDDIFPVFCKPPVSAITSQAGLLADASDTFLVLDTDGVVQNDEVLQQLEFPNDGVLDVQVQNDCVGPEFGSDAHEDSETSEMICKDVPSTSYGPSKGLKANRKSKSSTSLKVTLSYPVVLPKLTPSLETYVQNGMVLAKASEFYEFYGEFLRNKVPDGATNKTHYDVMARSVCDRHPELLTPLHPTRPWGVVSRHLSTAVRNARSRVAKAVAKHNKSNFSKAAKEKDAAASAALAVKVIPHKLSSASPHEVTEAEMENIAKLKEELLKVKGLNPHSKRLLQETFASRRADIEAQSESRASKVLELYPYFNDPHFVLHELTLIAKKSSDELLASMNALLDKLSKYFKVPSETDQDLLEVISLLLGKLKPQKTSKYAQPLVLNVEALTRVKEQLDTRENDAPRLVCCVDESNAACSSFIVADGTVVIELKNSNVPLCLILLVASYHVWYIGYAPAFKHVMSFFDEEILGEKTGNLSFIFRGFQKKFHDFQSS